MTVQSVSAVTETYATAARLPQGLRDAIVGLAVLATAFAAWTLAPHPAVVLPLAFLPVAALLALRHAIVLGIAFIVFSYFRIHEVFPQLMPLKIPLLLALGTLFALGWGIAFRTIRPFWDRRFTPFLCFFLVITLSMPLTTNPGNAIAYWKDTYVKIAIMVFALAWLIREERDFALLARSILLAASTVAIVALINKASGIGLVEGTRVTIGRDIGSMLGDPNDLSLVLLFGSGFAAAVLFTAGLPKWERVAGLIVFVLVASAIIATQSRGGLLGIATVTGVLAAQRIKSKVVLISLGAIALMALFAMAGISDRASGGAAESGIDESAMGRIHAWDAAFKMALHNPLTGVGLNNFYNNYYLYSDFWDGKNHAVHSTWLGVLAESGFVGFAFFMWMTVSAYRSIRRTKGLIARLPDHNPRLQAAANGQLAGFAGFCVSGTFLTQGFVWPIYIIFAVTVALGRLAERRTAARSATDSTVLRPNVIAPTSHSLRPLRPLPRIAEEGPTS